MKLLLEIYYSWPTRTNKLRKSITISPVSKLDDFSNSFGFLRYNSAKNVFIIIIELTKLARALDSKQARTSFGKLPLSKEKTAENYSFGKSNR